MKPTHIRLPSVASPKHRPITNLNLFKKIGLLSGDEMRWAGWPIPTETEPNSRIECGKPRGIP